MGDESVELVESLRTRLIGSECVLRVKFMVDHVRITKLTTDDDWVEVWIESLRSPGFVTLPGPISLGAPGEYFSADERTFGGGYGDAWTLCFDSDMISSIVSYAATLGDSLQLSFTDDVRDRYGKLIRLFPI